MGKNLTILRPLVRRIFEVGAAEIRDVDGGENPFLYTSKHRGPGYLMIKGLVSQDELLVAFLHHLAVEVLERFPDVEYVAGNVTGGVIPGWELAQILTRFVGHKIPYVYVRDTRKAMGQQEHITGDQYNSFFTPGRRGLVVEELVNMAKTTTMSAKVQREAGYDVRFAGTVVSYDHELQRDLLAESGVELISLLTLPEILDMAEEWFPKALIDQWRAFLADPIKWQTDRGYEPPKED